MVAIADARRTLTARWHQLQFARGGGLSDGALSPTGTRIVFCQHALAGLGWRSLQNGVLALLIQQVDADVIGGQAFLHQSRGALQQILERGSQGSIAGHLGCRAQARGLRLQFPRAVGHAPFQFRDGALQVDRPCVLKEVARRPEFVLAIQHGAGSQLPRAPGSRPPGPSR